jgi:hypothetical protein
MYALNMRNIESFFKKGDEIIYDFLPLFRYKWDPACSGLSVTAASAV